MLNYIWISLVAAGILVALGGDLRDELADPYRNGQALEATLESSDLSVPLRSAQNGFLVLSAAQYAAFYGIPNPGNSIRQPVNFRSSPSGAMTLFLLIDESSPQRWKEMARASAEKDKLAGALLGAQLQAESSSAQVRVSFEPVHFIRLKAVTAAAIDYASTAVNISLALIGVMALWLGVMSVAEAAGILTVITRILRPLTRRLFPDIPADHPAVGAMIMNIGANMLGLSNAATPLGIKAMEELNKLNPRVGTATNAMVTFLAINTGGLILIPATAIAVRAAAGSTNPGIIIGTSIVGASCATVAGVLASKLLQRLRAYRMPAEDPRG
ncbi:MAG TPA: nucleoside recognition domain-containing protein [Bacteroidota bacterium]|nr:nucleoside recognition domain-containing protein [Bacteroidota bacterium]